MSTISFSPWQKTVWQQALAAFNEGRLGHALLLTGPEKLGKAELAQHLAARLLCSVARGDAFACGQCRSCQSLAGGTHADFKHVSFELREKGDKYRSELVIEQIRGLGQWFALTPKYGGALVAVITPADAMNTAAANGLLKTLEEPLPNRFLLLVSDHPGRLPATIRSRCQRLLFQLPERAHALAWLQERGHSSDRANAALDAARGHPGQAHAWLNEDGMSLRENTAIELTALASGRQAAIELAQRWLADDHSELRLRFAADIAQELAAKQLGITTAANVERSPPADFSGLSAWFDRINRFRSQLDAPLRHDLLLAGLLTEWRNLFGDTARGAR